MAGKMRKADLEEARLIFRNFAGKEQQYNAKGDRNTGVLLSEEDALRMTDEGWNVKRLKPRVDDEGNETPGDYWLEVKISEGGFKPSKVILVSGNTKTTLTPDLFMLVDTADIKYVDIEINPYEWEVNGKSGVKAYLGKCWVVLNESELDRKYSDLEEKHESIKTTGPRFE